MRLKEFKEKLIFYKKNNDKKLFDAVLKRVKKYFFAELTKAKIKNHEIEVLSVFLIEIVSKNNENSKLLINLFSIDNDAIHREANELYVFYEYCFPLNEKSITDNFDFGDLVYTGIPRKDCKRKNSWFQRKLFQHERQVTEYFHLLTREASQQKIASSETVESKKKQNETNNTYLKSKSIKIKDRNGNFTSRSLDTLSKNPENIFIKYKIKILGLFDFAKKSNLKGYLITATLPPEFHPNSEDWSGKTPEQGHEKLQNTWRNFQKKINKINIKLFGVRIQEAHKDGCPHWHILIFVDISNFQKIKTFITESFKKIKLDIKNIDFEKNKIANYLLKELNPNDQSTKNSNFTRFEINDAYRATWSRRSVQFFDIPGSDSIWDLFRSLEDLDNSLENLPEDAKELHRLSLLNNYGDFLFILQSMNNHTQKRVKIIYKNNPKYPIGLSIDDQNIFIKN